MNKNKYEYLGKYYEFNHIGVSLFDLYRKLNGKLIKRNEQGSPYLKARSQYEQYIDIIESKGYRSMGTIQSEI